MSWRVPALLALTTWGAAAFGAVYPWAFIPLFGGCALLGTVALCQRREAVPLDRRLAIALGCLVLAMSLQLVPIPVSAIQQVSPETDAFLRAFEIGYATAQRHALSIRPQSTMVGLAAACALAILLLGMVRTLQRRDIVQFTRGLCALGVALAIAGMAQLAMWNGKIYGFWTPLEAGNPFGPFVNRNHFAGWMLMSLPLALSYFCGRVSRGMQAVAPGWRNRLLWFSTPAASETLLIGLSVLVMALGLTLTRSRSGILGLVFALAISGWFVARHLATAPRRMIAAVFLGLVLIAAIGYTGVDQIAVRFTNDATYGNRIPIWTDTLRIASRFPLVGTGLNTYDTSTLAYQTVIPTVHLAQAHSDYLQLLAEGGALVSIPALGLGVVIVRTIRRRFRDVAPPSTDYWIRVGAATGIGAVALQEIGEFSLQMPGNAVLFVMLLAIALRPSPSA
jgi:O-antigen ligase